MRRSVLVILLAGLAVPCTPALAATVHLNERTGFLEYRAAPGERNHVRITVGREVTYGGHDFAHYSVEDSARVKAGTGLQARLSGPAAPLHVRHGHLRRGARRGEARVTAPTSPGSWATSTAPGSRPAAATTSFAGARRSTCCSAGPGRTPCTAAPGWTGSSRIGWGGAWPGRRTVSWEAPESDLLAGSAGAEPDRRRPRSRQGGAPAAAATSSRRATVPSSRSTAAPGRTARSRTGSTIRSRASTTSRIRESSPVPVELSTEAGSPHTSVLIGCREAHPAAC